MHLSDKDALDSVEDLQSDTTVARHVYVLGLAVCLSGAAVFALLDLRLSWAVRLGLVGACLSVATLFAWWRWKSAALSPKWSILGLAWIGCALATLVAIGSGHGIQSLSLGFFALLVCLVAVLAKAGHAVRLALVCGVVLAGLTAADAAGWLDSVASVAGAPLSLPVIAQFLLLAGGLSVGLIVSRFAQAAHRNIAEREQRFRSLLSMVSDGYWELDAQLRFVPADSGTAAVLGGPHNSRFGLRPWETPDMLGIPPDLRSQVFDDLKAHRPMGPLQIAVEIDFGQMRQVEVSGKPRFAADGGFLGYWGVARDITQSERVRLEYAAILRRASIGIAFTRERRFVSANPMFERMCGWENGTLIGQSGQVVWPSESAYAEVGRLAGPLLAQGQPIELERQVRRKDGSLLWCRVMAQALDPADPSGGGTIWTVEDITDRRQTEQALAAARDAAEAANRAKSAFLANTSHEIRTPLNGLLGMARLAMHDGIDEPRRRTYLTHMLDSAQNLASILNDVLDLSKIEAGRIEIERAVFDLRKVLTDVTQAHAATAEAKGLVLALALDPGLPEYVVGDAMRVRQILSNFINNALKFTATGKILIEAKCLGGSQVHLAVIDTGPGIEFDVQSRLFERFSQADESTTRRFGGTGLGLSICRELARLMEGEVGVQSAPGQGSMFWAELPLPVSAQGPASRDDEAEELDALRGARILVAEDNPVNMLIVVAQLEQWGVEVAQAVDSALATEAVLKAAAIGRPFDAVLMDVHMPQMSGHSATRLLRESYNSTELPIVALTAAALLSERDAALQAGMCDFLTKPLDPQRMRRTLARLVVRRRPA